MLTQVCSYSKIFSEIKRKLSIESFQNFSHYQTTSKKDRTTNKKERKIKTLPEIALSTGSYLNVESTRDSISESDFLRESMAAFHCRNYKGLDILFKQHSEHIQIFLDNIKKDFIMMNVDPRLYPLLCNYISQLSSSFLEEYIINWIDKLINLNKNYIKFFRSCEFLMLSIQRFLSPQRNEFTSKLFEFYHDRHNRYKHRFNKIVRVNEIFCELIEGVSIEEAKIILSRFISASNVTAQDHKFFCQLIKRIPVEEARVIFSRLISDPDSCSKGFQKYYSAEIGFLLLKESLIDAPSITDQIIPFSAVLRFLENPEPFQIAIKNPKLAVHIICEYHNDFICHEEFLLGLVRRLEFNIALPVINMVIEKFLEFDIEGKLVYLKLLTIINDFQPVSNSTQFLDHLNPSTDFASKVVYPFSIIWRQQLGLWQEQLRHSTGGLDSRLGMFGLFADNEVKWLLFQLIRAFPDLYTELIEFLCSFINVGSFEDFERTITLIPSWAILTSEQQDKFIDILRCRLTEGSLGKDSHFSLIMNKIFEQELPLKFAAKLVGICLDSNFDFNIEKLYENPISVNAVLNCDDLSSKHKYDFLIGKLIYVEIRSFVERAFGGLFGKRSKGKLDTVRLYLLSHEGMPIGCWAEGNKETRISYEDFCGLQQRILVSHPLRTYITSYQTKTITRDFTFILRWLAQRLGSGWKINLSSNEEQLFIVREDRNLDLLRRARGALEYFTDDLTFKLDNKEEKLVIQGTSQEVNQFLHWFEEDYKAIRVVDSNSSSNASSTASSSVPIDSAAIQRSKNPVKESNRCSIS